jgi:hypothetical protein
VKQYIKTRENIPNGTKLFQMAGKLTEWSLNLPTTYIARPYKVYPNWYFWFENIPSGNPGVHSKAIPELQITQDRFPLP